MGLGIVKLGQGQWAVKDGNLLAAKETNGRLKNAEFTVTRGTDATYVNRNGLIVNETGDNTPRIDFTDNTDGHLLLEPQSTNLITYSEDFENSSWTKTGGTTVNATNILSPSGENNGTNITGLNGSGSNDLRFGTSINPSNKTYTASVFLKGSGTLRIQMSNNVDNASSTIVTLTSSWVRYDFTHTFNATTGSLALTLDDSGATATSYDVWGVQLEELSHPTSYIPTNGSTVTRDADTCTGAGEAVDFNSEEGVLYAEIAALVDDSSAREIALSDGTANNRVELRYGAASDRIQLVVRSGGVVQSSLSNSTNNILNFNKIAVKWKANDFALWINGVEQGSDISGSTPIGLNELQFNEGDGAGGEFYGKCKAVRVYKEALSDTDLENLTS